jgi:hypothetical protein
MPVAQKTQEYKKKSRSNKGNIYESNQNHTKEKTA